MSSAELRAHVETHSASSKNPRKRRLASVAPRASQACQACAASKVKCDDLDICRRCQKKGIDCIRSHLASIASRRQSTNISGVEVPGNRSADTLAATPSINICPNDTIREASAQGERQKSTPPDIGNQDTETQRAEFAYSSELNFPGIETLPGLSFTPEQFDEHLQTIDSFNIWNTIVTADSWGNSLDSCLGPNFHATERSVAETEHGAFVAQLSGPPIPTAMRPVSRDGEITGDITNAYTASLGSWHPEYQDYLVIEENDLFSSSINSLDDDDFSDVEDQHILNEKLTFRARDLILMMVSDSVMPTNVPACIMAFPALEILERFAQVFLSWHRTELGTFIHVPTFRPLDCDAILLTACVSSGAVRSRNSSIRKFGFALMDVVQIQLSRMAEKTGILTRKLPYLQAFLLQLQVGLWSGNKRKVEMAGGFVGILVNMLRTGARFSQFSYSNVVPSVEDRGSKLESKWRKWAEEESFKRLILRLYIHCSEESILKASIAPISYAELQILIPEAERLWSATTPTEWKELYLRNDSRSSQRLSLHNCLASPARLKLFASVQDSELAFETVIHCISGMILEARQRHMALDGVANIGEHLDALPEVNQESHILRLMNQTRLIWEGGDLSGTSCTILIELQCMHITVPFHQVELLLGKEGQQSSRQAYTVVRQWRGSRLARRAVWHAGQVLQAIRSLSPGNLPDFYAIATYQATVCLWTYGNVTPADQSSDIVDLSVHEIPDTDRPSGEVIIDSAESIETQKWISHNRGIPVMSKSSPVSGLVDRDGRGVENIPLTATAELIGHSIELLLEKFTGIGYHVPIVDNLCPFLRVLGKHEQS
ncbi:cytochrome p450 [Phlyctema vagabunda]|uniref:Cytochrome p450 n=1 Tax=Phlyctema vagabunda TaxID=108571 RepID=A0ABR4P1K7_9HELO